MEKSLLNESSIPQNILEDTDSKTFDFTKVPRQKELSFVFFAGIVSKDVAHFLEEQGLTGWVILTGRQMKEFYPEIPIESDIRLAPDSPRIEKRVDCLVSFYEPKAMKAEILKVPDSWEAREWHYELAKEDTGYGIFTGIDIAEKILNEDEVKEIQKQRTKGMSFNFTSLPEQNEESCVPIRRDLTHILKHFLIKQCVTGCEIMTADKVVKYKPNFRLPEKNVSEFDYVLSHCEPGAFAAEINKMLNSKEADEYLKKCEQEENRKRRRKIEWENDPPPIQI